VLQRLFAYPAITLYSQKIPLPGRLNARIFHQPQIRCILRWNCILRNDGVRWQWGESFL